MGNERLTTFPVWELNFGTLPDVMPDRDAQGEVGPQVPGAARHRHGSRR